MKSHYNAEGVSGGCPPVARVGSLHEHRLRQDLLAVKKVALENELKCTQDSLMLNKQKDKARMTNRMNTTAKVAEEIGITGKRFIETDGNIHHNGSLDTPEVLNKQIFDFNHTKK